MAQTPQRGDVARGGARHAWGAWRQAERLCDEAVQAEAALAQRETARAWGRPPGELHDRQGVQAPLHDAPQRLAGPAWSKARRVWRDPRTRHPLAWVEEPLAQAVAEPLGREAFTHQGSLREAMAPTHDPQRARRALGVGQRLAPPWPQASQQVEQRLRRAGAGVKRRVRRHQAR